MNRRRTEASQLIGADYQQMLGTYRHRSGITVVAFSPEGDRVLTGSHDNTARLWDARSGKSLGEPLRHENRVRAVAFSPDGSTIYTATDRWLRRFDLGRDPPALIPRSSRLLSGTWTGEIHFLRPDGGRLQVALRGAAANAVRIETLDLDHPDAPPLPGDPQILLAEWQQKLALTLAPDGRIVPDLSGRDPKAGGAGWLPLTFARTKACRVLLGPTVNTHRDHSILGAPIPVFTGRRFLCAWLSQRAGQHTQRCRGSSCTS